MTAVRKLENFFHVVEILRLDTNSYLLKKKSDPISFYQADSKSITLELAKGALNRGSRCQIEVWAQSEGHYIETVVTGTVSLLEELDGGTCRLKVKLTQFSQSQWELLLKFFSEKQKKADKIFNQMKGF